MASHSCVRPVFPYAVVVISMTFAAPLVSQLPLPPVSPTAARDCERFSQQVAQYLADQEERHSECLKDNKPDREETPDSTVCSRYLCQSFHDTLYGTMPFSAKWLHAREQTCYAVLNEYMAEEAQRVARSAAEKAKRDKEDADHAAKGGSQQSASGASGDPNPLGGGSDGPAGPQPTQQPMVLFSGALVPKPRVQAQEAKQSGGAGRGLPNTADPFGGGKDVLKQNPDLASMPEPADPFGSTDSAVDPFGRDGHSGPSTQDSELNQAKFEASSKIIELGTEKALHRLDQDIQYLRSHAGVTVNRKKASALISEIDDTKGVVGSVSHLLTGGQYILLGKDIVSADSENRRNDAWGAIIRQGASDVLHTDLVKDGMARVAPRLFGERVGLMLAGIAGLSVESGMIVLDSTKTDQNPTETIKDESGKISLSQKQEALLSMWRGYERRQQQTGDAPAEQLRHELFVNSTIVYNECVKSKSTCEEWRKLIDNR